MWLKCCAFFIFALFVNNVTAEGNCVIDDPGWEHKEFSIYFNDTDPAGTSQRYGMENIKKIEMDETYVTCVIKEKELIFSVTKQFEQYVEIEDESLHPIRMKLTCEDDGVVDFLLNFQVLDTTKREPEFIGEPYKFKLVLPIIANSIVENVKIEAKDINLGDEKLKFIVTDEDCSSYFEFTESTKELKIYTTYLKAKRVINQLDESMSCSIEVQDKDKSKDTSKMNLEVDIAESQPPNPIFKKPLYEATYTDEKTIEMDSVELVDTFFEPTFEIFPEEYRKYLKFNEKIKKLTTTKTPLPDAAFDDKNYIAITIQATYEKAQHPGMTIVNINSPKKKVDPIPAFQEPLYETNAKEDNKIEPITIILEHIEEHAPTIKMEPSKYRAYFTWDNNILTSKDPLPKETFETEDYITITIEAYYDETKGSGKTVLIINAPEKDEEVKDPIPAFEKPLYETDAKEDNTIKPIKIVLEHIEERAPTIEMEPSKYKAYFTWDNNILTSKDPLPEETFETDDYVTITIEAYYDETKGSGKTVLIINAPEKDEEVKDPIPAFEKPLYETDAKEDNTIKPIKIVLEHIEERAPTIEMEPSKYKAYFIWDNNILTSKDPLPKETFETDDYVTITIEAYYDETKGSGKTVLIINAPEKDEEVKDPIPAFEEPLYETDAKEDNTIKPIKIVLEHIEERAPTIEMEPSKYKAHFIWDNNILKSKDPLPEETFETDDYITITFEAYYDETKGSGKTVLIINAPEKDDDQEEKIPEFENPFYRTQYKNDDKMDPVTIKLKSPSPTVEFEIETEYASNFKLENDKFELIQKLPENTFDEVNYITVTIYAFYDKSKRPGRTVVIIDSPKQTVLKPQIWYEEKLAVYDIEHTFTGVVDKFTANSETDEDILYEIVQTDPDIQNKLEYNQNGELIVKEKLYDTTYFQITLRAKGKDTLSEDTMDVVLIIKDRINVESKFEYSLIVEKIYENSAQKTLVEPKGAKLEIIDKDSKEWFKIDDTTGNLLLKEKIDREDVKLKNMLKAQVTTKIRAIDVKSIKNSFKTSFNTLYQMKQRNDQKCIDISSIPYEKDIMHVVVTIEDENDEKPKFIQENPLIIGYPNSELAEFIAPPYLVKVTATDDDIGINAKIRYSVDKNFKIDSENGIIYPGEDLSTDKEFTVTATDKDGAKDGNKTPLKIKVKILEEKHITIVTLKNIAFSEVDDIITNIGKETNTKVRYLTSTALPNSETAEEKANMRQTRADDKLPVLRIVMYALDNDKVVLADDFQKLIEESDLSDSVEVKHYVTPSNEEFEEPDDSGWVAAVSTLSVLLALVLIGVIVGYIFYIRPRLTGTSIKYEKHTNRDSLHVTPVETKLETKVSDRRPTGFPVGFTPEDVDDDEYEELESVKEEKLVDLDDVFEESETSKPEPERKKSVVKFDVNVTEIEISEL